MATDNLTQDLNTQTGNKAASVMIWQSDSMEPAIDFGDEISVTPTQGIQGDGMYMLHLGNCHIQPPGARHLCAPVYKSIWRITRLDDGCLALFSDNRSYAEADAVINEAELLSLWGVVGRVSVVARNGRGLRAMGQAMPMDPSFWQAQGV